MKSDFPGAIPEIPVSDINEAGGLLPRRSGFHSGLG
jgi:hypothetical protein